MLNDDEEALRCERLRLQGVIRLPDGEQEVEVAGGKLNMTDIAARIGLGQLARLEAFTARRASSRSTTSRCFDARPRLRAAGRGFRRIPTGTCSRWCCRWSAWR